MERKEKFTPGPWIVKRDDWGISVICKESVSGMPFAETPICDIAQEEDTGGIEDAALIAAAPDMYAALKSLLDSVKRTAAGFPLQYEEQVAREEYAENALSKARGES